ncbi:GIY-YIG nuclease family protein [Bacillus cereus]|uniref:GIY-YIG nuclease family protein n=1 Tax=Bacillus cereus TaxID=1396 RepID=UPI0023E3E859|nr:GIY-YIG nuclease family protein [Bacillus cereus]MDF3555516.1 GIY-YIG nuclease family protein [Bacillus cereus]
MKAEELVYGFRDNETYLTLYFSRVDLEDFKTLQPRAGVYMIYSKENELMYIGETTSLYRRMFYHLTPNHGKKELNKDTVGHVMFAYLDEDRYERGIIEGLLVQKYRPALNCDDEMKADAMLKVDKEIAYDTLYYLKHTNIRDFVIAKALGVDNHFVTNVRKGGNLNHLTLPEGYKPTVEITPEFIEGAVITRNHTSQTTFNQIRELLEEGNKPIEISRQLGVNPVTVSNIKNLRGLKFKKWEEQRTNKAVA